MITPLPKTTPNKKGDKYLQKTNEMGDEQTPKKRGGKGLDICRPEARQKKKDKRIQKQSGAKMRDVQCGGWL